MIVGLGNPGAKYAATKHNVGFWAIDAIAADAGITVEKKQCEALTGSGFWGNHKVLLVKPQTFMNLSGQAVIQLLHYYSDQIDDLLIIHDDMDLPPGQLRFKRGGGGAGGHNGIKSIIQHLNSNDFDRLKIGIGRGEHGAVDYVLTPFYGEAKTQVDEAVRRSVEAVAAWLGEGVTAAMNKFN